MKVIFLGTPDFAVLPLEAIWRSKHEIVAVITQPDKPVGRKAIITPCAVKVKALSLGLNVLSYDKISRDGLDDLKNLGADVMVTCAYGQILSTEILNVCKYGVINVHASLLPKYRGSAPIQWSVINGDTVTGITVMQTEKGVDTGDILMQKQLEIYPDETAGELFDRLSILGAEVIVTALDELEKGNLKPIKQSEEKATHVKMLSKQDGLIDFTKTATAINNLIRGLNPWPVAYTVIGGKALKIFKAKVTKSTGKAGEVIKCDNELIIACGEDALSLLEVQLEGSKKMPISDFLRGRKLPLGSILGE